MENVTKCHAICASGKQCTYNARDVGKDGKLYCRKHVDKIREVDATLFANNLISVNTVNNHSERVAQTTSKIQKTNEKHKALILGVYKVTLHIFKKTCYTLLIMVILFMMHRYGKSYYYHHCDNNLIKTFLFKHTSTCQKLNLVLQASEGWFMTNISYIGKYYMMISNEFPFLLGSILH